MSYRLKNRQVQIPNGLLYYQPQTKWSSSPWASFDTIVQQVISHRVANAWLISQYGLSTDPATVADQVDEYNAQRCAQMGWLDYIDGPGVPQLPLPEPPQRLGQRVAGVASDLMKTTAGAAPLLDWLASGGTPVAQGLADKRASNCSTCNKMSRESLTSWFTTPLAKLITKALEARNDLNLKTPHDEKLGVCSACLCPMGLKVWMPLDIIESHLSAEVRADLAPQCWIANHDQ
jgi:hypothetical protein